MTPEFIAGVRDWRDYFRSVMETEPGSDDEPLRLALWKAHKTGLDAVAGRIADIDPGSYSTDELTFLRGWCRMVDYLWAAAWHTDFDFMVTHGLDVLPERLLHDNDNLKDLPDTVRRNVANVRKLADTPNWRYAIDLGLWRRMMRTRPARDEVLTMLDVVFNPRRQPARTVSEPSATCCDRKPTRPQPVATATGVPLSVRISMRCTVSVRNETAPVTRMGLTDGVVQVAAGSACPSGPSTMAVRRCPAGRSRRVRCSSVPHGLDVRSMVPPDVPDAVVSAMARSVAGAPGRSAGWATNPSAMPAASAALARPAVAATRRLRCAARAAVTARSVSRSATDGRSVAGESSRGTSAVASRLGTTENSASSRRQAAQSAACASTAARSAGSSPPST